MSRLMRLRRRLAERLDPARAAPPPQPAPEGIDVLFERIITRALASARTLALDGSFFHEIGPLVDGASLDARSAEELLAAAFRPGARLLDFGCGAMHSRPFIESLGYAWQGVDYLDSVSLLVRDHVAQLDDNVAFYDGRTLPFPDASFDVVWAMLVLHHIQHVDTSFAEIARVLRPGGRLIGQVAYLEQMQDFGTFNYTPYGFKVASATAGLRMTKVYPKHDAFAFLLRRLIITLTADDDTPLNPMLGPGGFFHRAIAETGERLGLDRRTINLLRLLFGTHFVFEVEKPEGAAS